MGVTRIILLGPALTYFFFPNPSPQRHPVYGSLWYTIICFIFCFIREAAFQGDREPGAPSRQNRQSRLQVVGNFRGGERVQINLPAGKFVSISQALGDKHIFFQCQLKFAAKITRLDACGVIPVT